MLVLSRRVGESLMVNGSIQIIVTAVRGREVRIGIEAPRAVTVTRPDRRPKPPPRGARR